MNLKLIAFLLTMFFWTTAAQAASETPDPLGLAKNFLYTKTLGAKFSEVKKVIEANPIYKELHPADCRAPLVDACGGPGKCLCQRFNMSDHTRPVEARIITLGIKDDVIVDIKSESGYMPEQSWNEEKSKVTNIRVKSFSGNKKPAIAYFDAELTNFEKGNSLLKVPVRMFFGKWNIGSKADSVVVAYCQTTPGFRPRKIVGSFGDCFVKDAVVSNVIKFDRFPKEAKIDLPF